MRSVGHVVLVLASMLFTIGAGGCGGSRSGSDAARGAVPGQASAATAGGSASPCRQPLPSDLLAVPAGNELELRLSAVGVQIYTCTATTAGQAWVFTAPEATLYEGDGEVAGKHYAGPTWQALDGSSVVGARVAGFTPDPSAIPWLLLRSVSHGGAGTMDEVTFIQRLATSGGLAPGAGCDASTVGTVARVPYTATYCLYEGE